MAAFSFYTAKSTKTVSAASQPGGAQFGMSFAPTAPVPAELEALELFCDDLLQDLPVQAQIRYQPLQTSVLVAQLS